MCFNGSFLFNFFTYLQFLSKKEFHPRVLNYKNLWFSVTLYCLMMNTINLSQYSRLLFISDVFSSYSITMTAMALHDLDENVINKIPSGQQIGFTNTTFVAALVTLLLCTETILIIVKCSFSSLDRISSVAGE